MIEMSLRNWVRAASIPLLLATLACSDDKKNPTEPVDPEPPETVTETFRGSLPQRQFACHDFTVTVQGDITVSVTDLEPLGTLTVGLGLGNPTGDPADPCTLFGEDDSVRVGDLFLSSNNVPGGYCACIFDVGNIFPGEVIDYTMDVTHP